MAWATPAPSVPAPPVVRNGSGMAELEQQMGCEPQLGHVLDDHPVVRTAVRI